MTIPSLSEAIYKLSSEEITAKLGVTKYDPPPVPCHAGNLKALPEGLSAYDLESCDNFPAVAAKLMDMPVCVTEKVEGMNFSVTVSHNGSVFVNQRNYTIEPIEGAKHDFWAVAESNGIIDFAKKLSAGFNTITVYGEYVGPGSQGNIYKMDENRVLLFDIMKNGAYLSPLEFSDACWKNSMETVPVLAFSASTTLRDVLNGKSIRDYSNGQSLLAGVKREGVVIKPMAEQRDDSVGRLVLKQRSPEYLAESDA